MKCSAVSLVQIILYISYCHGLPAYDVDTVEILANDIDENNIDGIDGNDKIDLSSLGPEAYGFPKNESGKSNNPKWFLILRCNSCDGKR